MCESLLDKDFLFVPAVDKMFLLRYSAGVATLFFYVFYYFSLTYQFSFVAKNRRISMVLLTHFKISHCGALSFTMIGQVSNLDPACTSLADGSLHYV